MRKPLLVFLSLLLVAVSAAAHGGRHRGVSISIDDDDDVVDCSDIRVRFDGERAQMIAEQIPFAGRSLRLRNEQHGGIRVSGWEGSGYAVTACKAAAPGLDPNDIRVTISGDEVRGVGPDEDRWIIYYLVRAPRNASLDLFSTNGGIGVYGVTGTIAARAVNGPVSIKESSGTIDAATTNGPISFGGGSGTVKLEATNGPVSVKLHGAGWEGGGLDASTQNGPVSLKLPRGYRSGVVVESLGHGPVTCRAEGCEGIRTLRRRYDDEPRRIELGSGPQTVRLTSVNGPVSVKDLE